MHHRPFAQALVEGDEAFELSRIALSGFVRIVTNPRIFATPDPIDDARTLAKTLRESQPSVSFEPRTGRGPEPNGSNRPSAIRPFR